MDNNWVDNRHTRLFQYPENPAAKRCLFRDSLLSHRTVIRVCFAMYTGDFPVTACTPGFPSSQKLRLWSLRLLVPYCCLCDNRETLVFPAVIPAFVASAKFGDIAFPLQYVIISTKARTAICE